MKLKQSFHLLLIALFIWTFQSVTIHSHQHLIKEEVSCHLCQASEQLDLHHKESIQIVVNEYIAVEVSEIKEKRIVKDSYDLIQTPEQKSVCYEGMLVVYISAPTFGFDAHAPPYTFS